MRSPFPFRARFAFPCLAAAGLVLSSCLSDAPPDSPLRGRFGNRLEGLPPLSLLDSSAWALGEMRRLSGDSYTYRRDLPGSPLGGGGETSWAVTVEAGVPVRLALDTHGPDGESRRRVLTAAEARAEWESGFGTLDSVYAECRAILETCVGPARCGSPPPQAYYAYDRDYILSACGCMDPARQDGHPSIFLRKVSWSLK